MASSVVKGDKYRSYLGGDEEKDTEWRHGAPPAYDAVNKLFEEGRTKVYIYAFYCLCAIVIGC